MACIIEFIQRTLQTWCAYGALYPIIVDCKNKIDSLFTMTPTAATAAGKPSLISHNTTAPATVRKCAVDDTVLQFRKTCVYVSECYYYNCLI